MAVVEVLHKFQARPGSISWSGRRESQETYLVVTDNKEHSAITMILLAQVWGGETVVPGLGQRHPADPYAICTDLKGAPASDDPFTWTVIATYATQEGDSIPPKDPDPVKQRYKFQWGHTTERRIVEVDQTGRALVNSAGQKFDPPIEIDFKLPTLFFERNERGSRSEQARAFANATNDSRFDVLSVPVAEGQAKVLQIRSVFTLGRSGTGGDADHYYVNSIELVFREEGWELSLLDIGTQERIDGKITNIVDDEGEQIRAPQLLNGSGRVLEEGKKPEFLDPFKILPRKNFGLLNLPTNAP